MEKKKMSKKAKIILFSIIGVVVLAAAAVGIVLALNRSESKPTGTVTAGSGEYEWRKTVTNIELGTTSGSKFYSNCEDDHISNVCFEKVAKKSRYNWTEAYHITYDQDFNIADDMNVFFVLTDGTNTYTTDTEVSHSAAGGEEIVISKSLITDDYYIKEVWVQTED